MRINKYLALQTGMSRRAADNVISNGMVLVNGNTATQGQNVSDADEIIFNGTHVSANRLETQTILLNKPVDFVCSRNGQGGKTIYDLLPLELHDLKPAGRLDKNSSGLLLLTNDGNLAHKLTHPSFNKSKMYLVKVDKPITAELKAGLLKGVMLSDGLSKFDKIDQTSPIELTVTIHEGRNRQIRRTIEVCNYKVRALHRTKFGNYELGEIKPGYWKQI